MIVGGFHKIPEALRARLATETFSLPVPTLLRRSMFWFTEVDARDLTVIVAPTLRQPVEGTRNSKRYEYHVGAFVIKQIAEADEAARQAEEDSLLTLVDEIQIAMAGYELLSVDGSAVSLQVPSDSQPPFIADAYRSNKTFIGVAEVQIND